MQDDFVIDPSRSCVHFTSSSGNVLALRVPVLFGAIYHVEVRENFLVVTTAGGRVSFHRETPRRVSNVEWRQMHPLAGTMHWHSIRKALREHCLIPEFARRVQFFITHHRYRSGGRSDAGSAGAVLVDGQIVSRCSPCSSEHGFRPDELGRALAAYLYSTPEHAAQSRDVIMASVALLDRRLSDGTLASIVSIHGEHPLYARFRALRNTWRDSQVDAAV